MNSNIQVKRDGPNTAPRLRGIGMRAREEVSGERCPPVAPAGKGRSGSVSVWSLGSGVHKVLFELSKHLWRVWGLILNVNCII